MPSSGRCCQEEQKRCNGLLLIFQTCKRTDAACTNCALLKHVMATSSHTASPAADSSRSAQPQSLRTAGFRYTTFDLMKSSVAV
jgi:hypothetical protein